MKRIIRWGLLVGVLVAGCGRDTDFLHLFHPTTVSLFSTTHTLKRLNKKSGADILWVIANGPGMNHHRPHLIKGANAFLSEVLKRSGAANWKMGVISMDVKDAPAIGFPGQTQLNPRTPNVLDVFRSTIEGLGSKGDKREQAFASIQNNLDSGPGFLRDDATLVIIFVTDASEQSNIPTSELMKFLLRKKGHVDNILVYGAFASPLHWGCPVTNDSWDYKKSSYEELITTTKGKGYHLCFDFGVDIANLSKDLITRVLSPTLSLKDRPIRETLRVIYQGEDLPGGPKSAGGFWFYDFDLNKIVFHDLSFAPGENEEVTVAYEVAKPAPPPKKTPTLITH